jgi:hypothetical protein
MAGTTQIPRSRGSISGLFLILLGAWAGLIPLVGPYLNYGFTPNKTWDLTQGRLYLSVIPGAAVLLAGLVILMTRSRGIGGFFAFVAALAGVWFIAGAAIVELLPASLGSSITTGTPIGTTTQRVILTALGFYAGVGALILFFASLVLGRFSIAAHKDQLRFAGDLAGAAGVVGLAGAGALAYDAYQSPQPAQQYPGVQVQYPSGQDSFPQAPGSYGSSQDQYGTSQSPYQSSPDPYPASQDPFPAAPDPYQGGQETYQAGGQSTYQVPPDQPTVQRSFPGEQDPFQPSP